MQDLIDEINELRGMRAETVRQIQEIDDMLAERETKLEAKLGTHTVDERRKYMRDHRPGEMLAVPAVMALDAVRESPAIVAVVASGVAVGLAAAICLAAPIAGDRPPRAALLPPSDSAPIAPPRGPPANVPMDRAERGHETRSQPPPRRVVALPVRTPAEGATKDVANVLREATPVSVTTPLSPPACIADVRLLVLRVRLCGG